METFPSCFLVIAFITILNSVCDASEWDYSNVNEWDDLYPACGGDTQSPINIDYPSVDLTCPSTSEHSALLWAITDFKRTYEVTNNAHALEMVPIDLFYGDEVNTHSQHPVAVLQNNFQTDSGEHQNFCLDRVHIHFGSNSNFGSEHTVNDKRAPMEMHFVHYSCDYASQDDALSDTNVQDPYVLAVVSLLFQVGETNEYFEHITKQIDYVINPGESMTITNADLSDLIPETTTDFFYYEGSLTTPECNPVVRWHILADRLSISEDQLEILRLLQTTSGDLDNNFRPVQDNVNSVYYCSAKEDNPELPCPEYDNGMSDVFNIIGDKSDKIQSVGISNQEKHVIYIVFVIAALCLVIGLCSGFICLSPPKEKIISVKEQDQNYL